MSSVSCVCAIRAAKPKIDKAGFIDVKPSRRTSTVDAPSKPDSAEKRFFVFPFFFSFVFFKITESKESPKDFVPKEKQQVVEKVFVSKRRKKNSPKNENLIRNFLKKF